MLVVRVPVLSEQMTDVQPYHSRNPLARYQSARGPKHKAASEQGQTTDGFFTTDQSLNRRKLANKSVLLGHTAGTKSQTGGDDGWKTFRNGSYCQSDGDFEIVDGALDPAATVDRVAEVADVDQPDGNADVGDHL